MKLQRALFACWILGIVSALCPGESLAVPMTDLFAGAAITADDKLFTDFTLITEQSVNGGIANFNLIDVVPLVDDPLNPGIKFQMPMPPNFVPALGTPFGHIGPSSELVIFSFNVRTFNQKPLIKDNSLRLNGWVFDSGPEATISVTEDVYDVSGNKLGDKQTLVRRGDTPGSSPLHFDTAEFAPQAFVHVVKTILIQGPGDNDGAFLTMFEQRFSQIPEPSTLAIACAFWLCWVVGHSRRSR